MRYSKYSGHGNFFSLPNEVFLLGLSAGELAVYSYLKRCEGRKTHQCWPSIKTIGQAVGMSVNTVRKYVRQLEERGIITTEPTEIITKAGEKRNGNLLFTLRPIQVVIKNISHSGKVSNDFSLFGRFWLYQSLFSLFLR